jgi:hypothetical protein
MTRRICFSEPDGGNDVSCFVANRTGQFIPGFVYFEHGLLVHTAVCDGGRQGSGPREILAAKMQSGIECHCRKLDLDQQPKSKTDQPYALGCSRYGEFKTV